MADVYKRQLLILIIAYLNWLLAILSVIVVVAVYLINYNTIHNRRRLADVYKRQGPL